VLDLVVGQERVQVLVQDLVVGLVLELAMELGIAGVLELAQVGERVLDLLQELVQEQELVVE
jgi:hypothetical protein